MTTQKEKKKITNFTKTAYLKSEKKKKKSSAHMDECTLNLQLDVHAGVG